MSARPRMNLIASKDPVTPPSVDRGRLVYDFDIPDLYFGGLPRITEKVRWVRSHLPRASRVKIGHDSAWYEADIIAYRDSLQKDGAA